MNESEAQKEVTYLRLRLSERLQDITRLEEENAALKLRAERAEKPKCLECGTDMPRVPDVCAECADDDAREHAREEQFLRGLLR